MAERSLSVIHLATTDLWWADPAAPARALLFEMEQRGFDAAPIREDPPSRFVDLAGLKDSSGTASDVARPIDISLLITAEMPLADAVTRLGDRPYYFLIESSELSGIVTRSDLQRPAVTMVTFSIILAAEMALTELIARSYGDSWVSNLSAEEQDQITKVYDERVRRNAEISKLDCMMLRHRLSLVEPLAAIRNALGYPSKSSFKVWSESLKRVRDTLAHGTGLLDAYADPVKAIAFFQNAREFAAVSWELAFGVESANKVPEPT